MPLLSSRPVVVVRVQDRDPGHGGFACEVVGYPLIYKDYAHYA